MKTITKILIIILVTTLLGIYPPKPASASTISKAPNNLNLVGYWSFNEGTGTVATDFSGNGNTGTLTNMEAADWTTGRRGKALDFDGVDDYIDAPDSSSLNVTSFTLAAWIKTSQSSLGRIIVKENTGGGGQRYSLNTNVTTGKAEVRFDASDSSGAVTATSLSTINDGNWHHIVGTFDDTGDTLKIYADGVLETTTATIKSQLSSNKALQIGRHSAAAAQYFSGIIDEARIYSRALTAAQVTALYQSGLVRLNAPNNNGLVGYWSFNEGNGTVATDFSGTGKNGTLIGGPTWDAGHLGRAVSFDGVDDNVQVSNFTMPSTGTISFWAKSNTSTWNSYGFLVSKRDDLIIHPNSGTATIDLFTNGINQIAANISVGTITNWQHYVWVLSGTQSIFYVNGAAVSTLGNINTWGTSSNTLYFGNDSGMAGRYFNGKIDEVRIYNRALTAAQVTDLYKSGLTRVNSSQATNRLTNGLVGYWTFNGQDTPWTSATAGTTKDSSPSGNTGTLTSMSRSTTPAIGKLGQALNFDGSDDYVSLPDASYWKGGSISISMWVNFTTVDNAMFVNHQNAGSAGGLEFDFQSSGVGSLVSSPNGSVVGASNTWSPTAGRWYHLVLTVNADTNTWTHYIDGAQTVSATQATDPANVTGITRIGHYVGNSDYGFNGKIDEVRVYNRALSASEVTQLYNLNK